MTTLDERVEMMEKDLARYPDEDVLRVKRETLLMLLDERKDLKHIWICLCGSRFQHPGELEGHKIKCGNWLRAVGSSSHDAAASRR